MDYTLSKSKFCKGFQCPKILWMDEHRPELAVDTASESILKTGEEVGKLARSYFDGCQDVTFDYDKMNMVQQTNAFMNAGAPVIAEASFLADCKFCSVDLLRRVPDGWELIEVKSSTEVHKIYEYDMAYQYYVLSECNVPVSRVYNMHINSDYVRHGDLELDKLFVLEDCTELVLDLQSEIEEAFQLISYVLAMEEEPEFEIGMHCVDPYDCVYKNYCHRNIPEDSVFDIHRLAKKKKYELYHQGIVSFEDIVEQVPQLSEKQWRQVKSVTENESPSIEVDEIRKFLETITYPLYYLDFETFQQAIPMYDGVSPYMQIPFQYSLHIQCEKDGELLHKEFLGKEGMDPRRQLAEQLCNDIPRDVCSLAYNMSFEKTVIRNLAKLYDDLAERLMNIHDHICDLMVPFQKQYYYCKELKGSYSIKWVLPALCGGDSEFDYHALEEVHNGSEAMSAFADLPNHSEEEIKRIRKKLLAYCRLDTLAMVKILEKLYEI